MKKNLLVITLTLFLSFFLSTYVLAYEEDYVKIALKTPIKLNYTVNLNSEGFQIGIWQNGFSSLFSINESKLSVRVDGYYKDIYGNLVRTDEAYDAVVGPYHVRTNEIFYSYDEALSKVERLRDEKIDAFSYYNNGIFEIWVGQYLNESMAMQDLTQYIDNINSFNDIVGDNKSRIALTNEKNEIILMFDKNDSIYLSNLYGQNEQLIKVENNSYRGFLTFSRKENELIVINHVSTQHYLYGVVPKEMPASWPLEALKAQAVAVKNYLLLNINKHQNEGYNLCDTQHCQVYGGYNSENIMTNRAADETKGKVLTYNNSLANTFYHSSSGGYTENNENVWIEEIQYLKGVKDDFSLGSPNDTWQFVISKEEINQKLLENGIDVGSVTSIEVLSASQNGRVQELLIRGTLSTEILKKEKSRLIFGTSNIKSTWFEVRMQGNSGNVSIKDVYIYNINNGEILKQSISDVSVLSSEGLFTIDSVFLSKGITVTNGSSTYEITNNTENNTIDNSGKYVFSGKGWGHGVGMSQWGAKGMAEIGYNYVDILEYYYTGAKVE